MSLLSQQLADDAAWMMADLDAVPGAEPVTVSADGVTERTVTAIVDRSPPAVVEGGGKVRAPKLRVTLANHATLGLALSALNTGKSYVKVAPDVGGAAKEMPLMGKPAAQDAGLLTFEW